MGRTPLTTIPFDLEEEALSFFELEARGSSKRGTTGSKIEDEEFNEERS